MKKPTAKVQVFSALEKGATTSVEVSAATGFSKIRCAVVLRELELLEMIQRNGILSKTIVWKIKEPINIQKIHKHVGRIRTLPDAEPRACKACGKVFTPIRKKWKRTYCSLKCQQTAWNPNWIPGQQKNVRYLKYKGRSAHRAVAEEMMGRSLKSGEVVHHIDCNTHNNDPLNLLVLPSMSEHTKLHARMRRAK